MQDDKNPIQPTDLAPIAPQPTQVITPTPASEPAPAQPQPVQSIYDPAPAAPLFADEPQPRLPQEPPHIEWTASEYISNTKQTSWYIALGFVTILASVAVYFIAGRDIVSSVVILIVAAAFGVFSSRPPQILNYAVDNTGLYIGNKFYPYDSFRSFSVVTDGAMTYISLLSLGRFMPPLIIHYEPSDESQIADVLATYLPYEDHKPDLVDTIARKIRF